MHLVYPALEGRLPRLEMGGQIHALKDACSLYSGTAEVAILYMVVKKGIVATLPDTETTPPHAS
jgi:hypothetical protein